MTLHYSDMVENVDALPVAASARPAPSSLYRNVFKRLLDVSLLVLFAPVLIPVICLLALIVYVKTGASPFYSQKRVGKGGRIFTMWKLRTMVVDADERLAAYLASDTAAKAEWESTQKLKNDPRITRTGRILRKTSLDELPQLWNVMLGDMSLVGPRPMLPEQRVLYPGSDYYDLRPGLTGLWQISDRNECSFSGRAQFDTTYNNTVSIGTDASVLLATVAVVLRGTGY